MQCLADQGFPTRKFQKWNAFLGGTSGDDKEVAAVALRESTITFSKIRRDRQRCSVQLVGEEVIAAGNGLSQCYNMFGEIDGLLIDRQIFEHECHAAGQELSRR